MADPWERMPAEGAKAFAAFSIYRDQGPLERSLSKTARTFRRSASLIARWSSNYRWVGRVAAWDAENERVKRGAQLKDIETFGKRQVNVGQLLMSKAVKRFSNMTDAEIEVLSVWEALRMLEFAIRLQRDGYGQPEDGPLILAPEAPPPLLQFLRQNPERIGPVVEALALLRSAVPELSPGVVIDMASSEILLDDVDDDDDEDPDNEPMTPPVSPE